MAVNVATLIARVVADTAGFQRGMDSVEGRMATAGTSMMRAGMTLTRGITIPLTVAAGAAIKFSIDFHRQMEMIHTQAGASQAEVNRMTEAVMKLAPSTAFGPEKLAEALYHIESVGQRGAVAMNTLKVAAEGAAVGNANLEDTASALVGLMRVYHLSAGQASQAMGDLNAVVGAGNMRIEDMVNSIQTGLFPTTKGLQMSFRETGAALATMTDESVPAQVAATRLRTLFLLMSGETKKSADVLKTLGIGQLDLAHAMARPGGMINALEILREHLNKMTSDPALQTQFLAKAFGGARSSGTIIQLLNNLEMVRQKLGQINNTAGNFPEATLRTQQTAAYQLHEAWSTVQTTLVRVGDIIAPVFLTIAKSVASLVNAFERLSPHTQRLIVFGGLIAAALGPAIFILGAMTSAFAAMLSPIGLVVVALSAMAIAGQKLGILKPLIGAITGITLAIAGMAIAMGAAGAAETLMLRGMYLLDAAMATNPFLLAVGAIGGLIGALFALKVGVDNSSAAFKAGRDAIDAWTQAANRAHNTALAAKDAHLAVLMAQDAVARSQENLTRLQRSGHASALDLREAHHQVQSSLLSLMHAQDNYKSSAHSAQVTAKQLKDTHDASVNSVEKLRQTYARQQKEIQDTTAALKKHGDSTRLVNIEQDKGRALAGKFAGELQKLAKHAADVASANAKAHPQIAAAAAKIRDQALATQELTRKLGTIPGAVAKASAAAHAQAVSLGVGITSGVLAGLAGLGAALAGQMIGAVAGAIAAAKAAAVIHSPSEKTKKELGQPLGQGLVLGFLLGSRDLPDKMKDSVRKALEAARNQVQSQQGRLTTAFDRLADYALRAFDARTQAHLRDMQRNFDKFIKSTIEGPRAAALSAVEAGRNALTPAEQQLRDMQRAHDEAQRQASIGQAQTELANAQLGGDPDAIKQAQGQLDEAMYEEQIAHLQDMADAQRQAADAAATQQEKAVNDQYDRMQEAAQKEYDRQVLEYQARRDLQRQHLEDQLAQLEDYLSKHPGKWKQVHAKIMKLFAAEFGPDYATAGENLGLAFAQGLRESFAAVRKTAQDLAKLIARYLKLASPAEAGPLSDLHHWWDNFAPTLLQGLDSDQIGSAVASAVNPRMFGAGSRKGDDSTQALLELIQRMDMTRPLIGEYHQNDSAGPEIVAVRLGQQLATR